ncbi:hypothetical protein A8C56_17010 [Niabella ginsenosidivorans]|uniref:Membrane receptor RagA n=1 Tax=Niabella ginsenosidivorans TaxID=1176587 RepID=A0A1A9IB81_9BACT|nr:hypothetical protein A8C56_17010 [Niabella ginsenosidivorans]
MRLFFTTTILLGTYTLPAQEYSVSGKVLDTRLQPVAFATVQLKGQPVGQLTKEDGSYSFSLSKGIYDLAVTMVGYQPQVVKIVVDKRTVQQNIILQEEARALSGVTVSSKIKDRAAEYIREVIRRKERIEAAHGAYSVLLYIKAVQTDSLPTPLRKKKKRAKPVAVNAADSALKQMAMAELSVKLDHESDSRFKEERLGVVKRGNVGRLFYLTTTDGSFNLYDNLMKVPAVSVTPFLSPISYSGLIAYRFKTLKTESYGNHKKYTIAVIPGKLSNAAISGHIVIDDSLWVIHEAHFTLPGYHLADYDYFEVNQQYEFTDSAWMPARQEFVYYSRAGKGKVTGTTTVTYRGYELRKKFDKKYFGNELSTASAAAYKRDSTFWQQARTEPLTPKELQFIKYKDSIYTVTHSKAYLDSVDRALNKITLGKIVYKGQPLSNHEKGTLISFPALAMMINPFAIGGLRVMVPVRYSKLDPVTRKTWNIYTDVNYGFLNKDVNGRLQLNHKYNAFTQANYSVSVVRDFASFFQGDAWINQLKRVNYYLDNSLNIGWGRELVNGLQLNIKTGISLRRSLANYKTYNFIDSLSEDLGEGENKVKSFEPYNAFYSELSLRYTPFQPYIREPNEKIILSSKWPTAFVNWRKGVPGVLNSKVNFDYLEMGFDQVLKLGLVGVSSYSIKTGAFLSTKMVNVVDYKYQRRGDPIFFMNPSNAFQSLDSTFPVFKRFYEAHYLYEFNGAILNKIPLLKKIGLREVVGGGFLIAPERSLRYGEVYAGIERVLRIPFLSIGKVKLGVYTVGSLSNQFKNPVQFKVGLTTWDLMNNRWR